MNAMDISKNYYELLGISPNASLAHIRQAFRQRIKEVHPDTTSEQHNAPAEENIHQLLHAYRILTDPDLRHQYDRTHSINRAIKYFDFRAFLKKRTDDAQSQARLIIYDLLHDHEHEAIELYERYFCTPGLKPAGRNALNNYFRHGDYMDCLYLLAEAYEHHDAPDRALNLYYTIARNELQRPYFREFFAEVRTALRRTLSVIASDIGTPRAIRCAKKLLALNISPADSRYYYQFIATQNNIARAHNTATRLRKRATAQRIYAPHDQERTRIPV